MLTHSQALVPDAQPSNPRLVSDGDAAPVGHLSHNMTVHTHTQSDFDP
jgi:hypothetical protein